MSAEICPAPYQGEVKTAVQGDIGRQNNVLLLRMDALR
jgi:hypothetical protein